MFRRFIQNRAERVRAYFGTDYDGVHRLDAEGTVASWRITARLAKERARYLAEQRTRPWPIVETVDTTHVLAPLQFFTPPRTLAFADIP